MELGLSMASRSGLEPTRFAAAAAAAEAAGLDAFAVAERVADGFALAQAAVAATHRIEIGTAVANARLRHPALVAMTAATLDELSGGRFGLGLGVANVALNETTLGLDPVAPVGFMREYVEVVRSVLAQRPEAGGSAVPRVRALRLDRAPARSSLPVVLAGLQPRMLRLAGEIADGVLLNLVTPATIEGALAHVGKGLADAGRRRTGFRVSCVVPCSLGTDADVARRIGRELVAGYALHPAATRLFAATGHGGSLDQVGRLLRAGDRGAALAAVDDRLADEFLLHGDRDAVADRLTGYAAAGVDRVLLFPLADADVPQAWAAAVDRTIAFAEAARGRGEDTG